MLESLSVEKFVYFALFYLEVKELLVLDFLHLYIFSHALPLFKNKTCSRKLKKFTWYRVLPLNKNHIFDQLLTTIDIRKKVVLTLKWRWLHGFFALNKLLELWKWHKFYIYCFQAIVFIFYMIFFHFVDPPCYRPLTH